MDDPLLGTVLLKAGAVTRDQLQRALSVQREAPSRRLLGEILLEQKLVDEGRLEAILSHTRRIQEITRVQHKFSMAELEKRLAGATGVALLKLVRDLEASDLHYGTGEKPVVRIHGNLVDLPAAAPTPEAWDRMIASVLPEDPLGRLRANGSLDAALEIPGAGRFRVNLFRHHRGAGAVFRVIPELAWAFERTGLPPIVKTFAEFPHGLVLVTGPIGSGKTTTLASLLHEINRTQRVHVVTLEDPIEYVLRSDKAFISQREIGRHSESFASGLRAALREDPDVLVVGELRDTESVQTAVTAAETGHLVFATLHTPTAHRTVLRLVDQFPLHKRAHLRAMLASSLRAVVCQQLVPNVDGKGRSLAVEILVVTPAVANLIREERTWQIPVMIQTGGAEGMRRMDDSLRDLVRAKRISVADALSRATDRERILE